MSEYDPLFTMSALNMAIVSLYRITSSGDRLTLDREYTNIINNIRIGEINDDQELTNLYGEIMRAIHKGKLRDELRSKVSESYSQCKKRNIREIIAGNVMRTFRVNPLAWLEKLASSSASEYFAYMDEESKHALETTGNNLKLSHEELNEYDELQRNLLGASWALLRKYHLSDSYRLTQEALVRFSAAINVSDPSKRQRMLGYIERDFSMYSPYWFYRVKAAHETQNDDEAEEYFTKFKDLRRPVLLRDPYQTEAMKYNVDRLMQGGFALSERDEIMKCLDEMRQNTQLNDWANNIYMGMMYFTLGQKEKAIRCVMCNIDFEFETEHSTELIQKFETETPPTMFELVNPYAEREIASAQYNLGDMYYYGNGIEHDYAEAVNWYCKAAEQGYAKAQYKLGVIYYYGNGVTRYYAEAVKWYLRAAEQGYAQAQNDLGDMYYYGYGVEKNHSEAVRWYQEAAENGNVFAQYNLGNMYFYGEGTTQDKLKAEKWYNKAAEQGHVSAQYTLGVMYSNGEGVEQNYTKAVYWYRKAAAQGYAQAQNKLGNMYYYGYGVDQDKTEAVNWYCKAAEQGNAKAQYKLGVIYYYGYGVARDYKEAFTWYLKAAEQGYVKAQYRLGGMYYYGYGVDQNKTEAMNWYCKAANHGYEKAQYNLGNMYNYGDGITQDKLEAAKWYLKVAEQGNAKVQYKLGVMYYYGEGVEQDYEKAIYWYRKVAQQGYINAQEALKRLGETW